MALTDPSPTPTVETGSSPWLADVYAPVTDEIDTADLSVSGVLPSGLRGAFLRNGPNAAFAPLGAKVYDIIGCFEYIQVMLDHHHRIPSLDEAV